MKMKEANWSVANEKAGAETGEGKKRYCNQGLEVRRSSEVTRATRQAERRLSNQFNHHRQEQQMLLGDISARHDINLCKDESLFSENETNDREMSTPRVLEDRTGVEFSSSNKEKTSSTSDNTPRSNVRLVDTIQGNQDLSTRRQSVSNRSVQQVKRLKQAGVQSDNKGVNLSFCGCGFLGIYHVGVASCFHQYAPRLSMNKIAGSSAGALVAMSHICGNLQLAYCTTDILTVAIEARSRTLGSFHPSFDIQAQVREALERGIPKDAYLKANGVLHVSLTRVEDGANVIVSE